MTQLNSKNVTHKESDNVYTVRKYFRIYTKDRVFNVYKDYDEEKTDFCALTELVKFDFEIFMTYNDTPIYIKTKQIDAVEIATYMFPERT